ncbi:MAG: glutaredoxin family protein [Pseudomonadota bacterium]
MRSILSKFLAISAVALVANSLLTATSMAQQVYRIVGPDGKVTFSDQPPPAASAAKVTSGAGNSVGGAASGSLPFELRQVANKYPVTLYTGENCVPCLSARSLLTTRGVPFTEKTVLTFEDSQALQRLSGDTSLPFATIGGQQLKGFADTEWTQFLNAAGYPVSSVLPPSYRQPAATPLVAVTAAPSATQATTETSTTSSRAAPRPVTPAPAPVPANTNPAGIQF